MCYSNILDLIDFVIMILAKLAILDQKQLRDTDFKKKLDIYELENHLWNFSFASVVFI